MALTCSLDQNIDTRMRRDAWDTGSSTDLRQLGIQPQDQSPRTPQSDRLPVRSITVGQRKPEDSLPSLDLPRVESTSAPAAPTGLLPISRGVCVADDEESKAKQKYRIQLQLGLVRAETRYDERGLPLSMSGARKSKRVATSAVYR